MKKITFITTGGTIDKIYASKAGTSDLSIGEPAFLRVLEEVNPFFDYECQSILHKDSLEMTDQDRQKILQTTLNCDNEKIIITHGTDTMTLSAQELASVPNKTIILTGSAKPEIFKNSDAAFNLGCAVGAVQSLPCGVYITMNGMVHPWDQVQKEQKTGQFIIKP